MHEKLHTYKHHSGNHRKTTNTVNGVTIPDTFLTVSNAPPIKKLSQMKIILYMQCRECGMKTTTAAHSFCIRNLCRIYAYSNIKCAPIGVLEEILSCMWLDVSVHTKS